MRKHRSWAAVHGTIGLLYWIAGVSYLAFGAALKADPNLLKEDWAKALVNEMKAMAPIAVIGLSLFLAAGKLIRGRIGSPWAWDMIHRVLDNLRDIAFSNNHGSDPPYHHRVTLFRAVGFRRFPMIPWPTKHWLVPYERSGHVTRRSTSRFRISDQPELSEGIAGATWARNQVIVVSKLPTATDSLTSKRNKEIARRSFVSEEYVMRNQPQARTYCGMPVETNGVLWGVVVFDSRGEDSIDGEKASNEYRCLADLLGQLVAKG